MYKHLLVPTDGTRLSGRAVRAAIELARASGAGLTFLHVSPEYPNPVYLESAVMAAQVPPDEFRLLSERHAKKVLDKAAKEAGAAGLTASTVEEVSGSTYEAIMRVAARRKCDLIVMASHGRRGLAGLLLGSETHKVLTHAKLPVLVVH